MKLIDQTTDSLAAFVLHQMDNLIPDGHSQDCGDVIRGNLDEALRRTNHCINSVAMWCEDEFNYMHSSQYCTFLYYLANTIWQQTGDTRAPTRLFNLNKALNGIDLFYEIEMPKSFFIGHSVGIVLAKATYGEHLVLYQNSTVGKNDGVAPVIGDRVVIHPNCAIIGRSTIADGSVLSQGTSVINKTTTENAIVYQGANGGLTFKLSKTRYIENYFRL